MRRILNSPDIHQAAEIKPWDEVRAVVLADLKEHLGEQPDADVLTERLADSVTKKKELGERVRRWAMYAARAYGLQGVVPSDREAEILLAALAVVGDRRQGSRSEIVLIQNETKGPRFYQGGGRVLPADGLYRLVPVVETEAIESDHVAVL